MGNTIVALFSFLLNVAVIIFVVGGTAVGMIPAIGGGSSFLPVVGAIVGLLLGATATGFGFVLISINNHLKRLVDLREASGIAGSMRFNSSEELDQKRIVPRL